MSVGDLLTASQRSHLQAQVCRKQKDRAGHLDCCRVALDLRLQAHELDPDHRDPAWAQERTKKFHHDALITFYEHELARVNSACTPLSLEQIRERIGGVKDGEPIEESLAYQQLCREHGV